MLLHRVAVPPPTALGRQVDGICSLTKGCQVAGPCMAQDGKGSHLSLPLCLGLDLRPQTSEVLNALYT